METCRTITQQSKYFPPNDALEATNSANKTGHVLNYLPLVHFTKKHHLDWWRTLKLLKDSFVSDGLAGDTFSSQRRAAAAPCGASQM